MSSDSTATASAVPRQRPDDRDVVGCAQPCELTAWERRLAQALAKASARACLQWLQAITGQGEESDF